MESDLSGLRNADELVLAGQMDLYALEGFHLRSNFSYSGAGRSLAP